MTDDPSENTDRAAEKPDLVATLAERAVAFRNSEPAESLAPVNRRPRDFTPPPKWRNAPAAATPAAGAR